MKRSTLPFFAGQHRQERPGARTVFSPLPVMTNVPPQDDRHYEDLPRSEFLQLPKEEQDRLYQLRQQRVREAPTLYEWDLKVATVYGMGWLAVMIPCGIMVLMGLVAHWYESDQWYGFFSWH